MKIAVTSDLHGYLPEIEPCDILMICGDIMPLWAQSNMIASEEWLCTQFLPWCRDNNAKNVVFVAGNHDHYFERKSVEVPELLRPWAKHNIYYLCNTSVEIEDKKIFGTPFCKIFGHWAFMRSPETLQKLYSDMPADCDIVISHDCPYGVHDVTIERDDTEHIGNPQLLEALIEKCPKYHFSGHLHGTDHSENTIQGKTITYSVSLVDERYEPVYPVLYLEI